MDIFTSSPGKYVWTTGAVIANLLKLPLLPLYYLPVSRRPHPEWTITQAVLNNLMNAFVHHTAAVRAVTPWNLTAGSLGERFIGIDKGPDRIYTGPLSDPRILPSATGGIWFPRAPEHTADGPVILHFHPGGYVMGDVRSTCDFAASLLHDKMGCPSFWSLYRLASNDGGRFPAALQDAVTAYHHLSHNLGIPTSRIILSGDSAGGHMVICLLRYIADHGEAIGLAPPKAALIWSAAINFAATVDPKTVRENKNYPHDYMDPDFVVWGATKFFSDGPLAAPYMNPVTEPFPSPCPVWAFVGGNEIFYDENRDFVDSMNAMAGNAVSLRIERLANHDIFFAGNLTGWKKEAEDAANEARKWIVALP